LKIVWGFYTESPHSTKPVLMEFCLYLIAHLHIIIESVDMINAVPGFTFLPCSSYAQESL